ncbi:MULTISPECIES: V-type ATP synthase subunit E [Tetragenococcus]|uniref:Uncharacterized protein n=3 Tax=Tetragenococcus TaxID=51668 RepID=A0A091C4R1_9ENTE|nr:MULTISPECIES: V-type ATP synthase subunit E family protein [Tetragenococcus]GMA53058.1 hypothetical protein GCM10025857_44150 [Alicyclobacillus contaminans]AYW47459.1 ATPase [Tetragenococcus osmophilus]KFN92816.1 hypothetical protein TMU3MR103_0298 [Tetragenococcus muriaticus 3MR10-3]MCF1616748.1 ATPase [Tetragenococcus koreensis]MCF1621630.1 ATPase [Tetragenococcus koreensis]
MPDITNLTEKITQDAQKRQRQYIKKAQRDIEKNEQEKKKQIQKQLEENIEKFKEARQSDVNLKISDLHLTARSQILAAKQQLLRELFAEALKRLRTMSAKEFNQFVTSNLKQVDFNGNVEMVVAQNSIDYATEENKQVWQEAAVPEMNLSISQNTVPKRGGFLLRQGEIEYNFTFEAMLSTSEEELSSELLNLIFKEE